MKKKPKKGAFRLLCLLLCAVLLAAPVTVLAQQDNIQAIQEPEPEQTSSGLESQENTAPDGNTAGKSGTEPEVEGTAGPAEPPEPEFGLTAEEAEGMGEGTPVSPPELKLVSGAASEGERLIVELTGISEQSFLSLPEGITYLTEDNPDTPHVSWDGQASRLSIDADADQTTTLTLTAQIPGDFSLQVSDIWGQPLTQPLAITVPKKTPEPVAQAAGEGQYAAAMDVRWARTEELVSTVEVGQGDSLRVFIDPGSIGAGDAADYKFIATYANDDPYEEETGFAVTNSGKFVQGGPVDGKQTLVYELEPGNITAETSILFTADPQKVYPGEKLRVAIDLYRMVEGKEDELIGTSTAYLDSYFLTAGMSGRVALKKPASIAEGASQGLYEAGFSVSSLKTAGVNVNGGVWSTYYSSKYVNYDMVETELDFKKITITAGGYTHTYEEWLNPAVYTQYGFAEPPVMLYRDSAGLDPITKDASTLFYAQSGSDKNADYNPGYYPFYIKTTEDFAGAGASIDFQQLGVLRSIEINGRRYPFEQKEGALADFENFNDRDVPLIFVNTPAGMQIKPGAVGTATTVMRLAVADASVPYLQYDSQQYAAAGEKLRHLHEQELFKTEIMLTGEQGDVELTFSIPENTKVTHVRIPGLNGENVYESVTVGDVTTPAPEGNYALVEIPEQEFGEKLTIRVNGLQTIKSSLGRPVEYPKNLLQFIGVTNDKVKVGETVEFALESVATSEGAPINVTGTKKVKTTVTDQYWVDVFPDSATLAFEDANSTANPVSSIEKGEPFYLSIQFYPSHYPYGSTLLSDPADPMYTTLLPNPVVYFLLPEGLEADLGHIQLFQNTTGSRGFELLGDDPANLGYTARSLGKNDQGKEVIEIKIHGATPEDSAWIPGYAASRLRVSMPVNVPPEADVNYIEMTAQDALIGTWGERSVRAFSGGAAGSNVDTEGLIPSDAVLNGGYAVRSNNARTTAINLTSSKNAQVYAAVRTDALRDRYQSYNSNVPESFPAVRAGSREEQLLVRIYNGMNKKIDNAEAFFLMPARNSAEEGKWRTMLTGMPELSAPGMTYEIYYTTEDLLWQKPAWTLDDLKKLSTWEKAENGEIPEMALGQVTGFRFVFPTLRDKDAFQMTAKFGVPMVREGTKPEYGATAAGQMLFDFGEMMQGENANTAAVKLRKTDPPIVMEPDGTGEKEIPAETTVLMHEDNGMLPEWDKALAYDDFTAGLKVSSIRVEFTSVGGQKRLVKEFMGAALADKPYTSAAKVPGLEIDYAEGNVTAIDFGTKEAVDYVNTAKAGTYTVTYLSEKDEDAQRTSVVRTIRIEKPESQLQATDAALELFMGDSVPEGFADWQEYMRSLIAITDAGQPVTADAQLKGNGFDEAVPGVYPVQFIYEDKYEHTATATVAATVKYKGTVSGRVTSNGRGIENVELSASGLAEPFAYTAADGSYRFEICASGENPTEQSYALWLTRDSLPDGVKHNLVQTQNAGHPSGSGTGNAEGPHPVHDFELEPIVISVEFDRGAARRAEKVSLYAGDTELLSQPVEEPGEYLFRPESGSGWFDPNEGEYRVVITPKEGMADDITEMGDFVSNGDDFRTEALALEAEDIRIAARASAPLGEYLLTYLNYEGLNSGEITYPVEESAVLTSGGQAPEISEVEGYKILGWYDAPEGGKKVEPETAIMPEGDLVLYAVREAEAEETHTQPEKPAAPNSGTEPTEPNGGNEPGNTENGGPEHYGEDPATPVQSETEKESVPGKTPGGMDREEALQVIEREDVPSLTVGDVKIPLSGVQDLTVWSLNNLILLIVELAASVALAVGPAFGRKRARNEKRKSGKKRTGFLLTGILAGIVSLIAFLATQKLSGLMVLFDGWSWLFFVLLAAQAVAAWLAVRKNKEKEQTQ